ncbi:hypothetical protein ASE48_10110 [Mycobacterium sp. Root265]|nr:hypothetical protein ASE48_10110 [Mycobacterium sp. Root265]
MALSESGIRMVKDQLYPDLDAADVVVVVNFNYSSDVVDKEPTDPESGNGPKPWRGLCGYDTA